MIKKKLLQVVSWVRKFIRKNFHSENEDLPYYITILLSLVVFIVAINGFVELTEDLAENELESFDAIITEYIISFRTDALTGYLTLATHLGDRYAYIVFTILLAGFYLIKHRSWKFILQTTLVLLLASLSNVVLKRVIHRARPSLEHLVAVNTLSYPSGHAMSAMAFYGFLVFLCVRYKMPHWIRYILVGILVALILSVGVSRIYLGVHYPSDVAAGFIGGLIWVTLCAVLFSLFDLLRKRNRRSQS